MSVLTVVDLGAAGVGQRVLRLVARIALRLNRFVARLTGNSQGDSIVLLLSQGGSAAETGWLAGSEVVTPIGLLDLERNERSVQEAIHEAVLKVTADAAALFPTERGVPFSELSRLIVAGYVRRGMLLLRAVDEICWRRRIDSIVVISGNVELARAVATQFRSDSRRVVTLVPSLIFVARQLGRILKEALRVILMRRSSRPVAAARTLVPPLPTDMLIVSESAPMRLMFELVEQEIAEQAADVKIVRAQYGEPPREVEAANRVVRTLWLQRPDDRIPSRRRYGRAVAKIRHRIRAASVSQQVLGRQIVLPITDLLEGLHVDVFDQQSDHLGVAAQLLDATDPALVVVGNDRWWIGQAFVKLAQQRGIPTLMLQDGVATEASEWYWSTADHLALSSDFLASILREHGESAATVTVVGQPRYDATNRQLMSAERDVAQRQPESADDRTILFATQTLQDFAFVETVVEALLKVERTTVLLRPHPSEDSSEHMRLANARPERIRFGSTVDVFAALRESHLLVCQSSTVVLEAALLGIPAVTVNFTGMLDPSPYARLGLALSVSDPSRLTVVVRRLVEDAEFYRARRLALQGRSALETLLGPVDGLATERTGRTILSLLDRSGRGRDRVASSPINRVVGDVR